MDAASWLLRQRRLMRSPLVLYRYGLDRVLGSRLVMLEYRGQVSGRTRQVVPRPGREHRHPGEER